MSVNRRLVIQPEEPSEGFPPGALADFGMIGEATMAIDNGLLTTADAAQVDAVRSPLGEFEPTSPSLTFFPFPGPPASASGLMLAYDSNPNVDNQLGHPDPNNGYPTYWSVGKWPWPPSGTPRSPAVFLVQDTSDVAGYVGTGGIDMDGHTGVTGNHPGDLLLVNHSGPYITDTASPYPGYWFDWGSNHPTYADWNVVPGGKNAVGNFNAFGSDTYCWDGSQWVLIWQWIGAPNWATARVLADHGLGRGEDWQARLCPRGTPTHPNIYACNWTRPGPVGEDIKFRAQFSLLTIINAKASPSDPHIAIGDGPTSLHGCNVGVTLGMTSLSQGLTWMPWGSAQTQPFDPFNLTASGWTKRPADLKQYGAFFPPQRVRGDGSYGQLSESPQSGTFYADLSQPSPYTPYFDLIHGPDPQYATNYWSVDPGGNFWIEMWRQGNRAFAAYYDNNPDAEGVEPMMVSEFPEDLAGGPFDSSHQLYFGVVFPYLNRYAGLVHCEYVRIT